MRAACQKHGKPCVEFNCAVYPLRITICSVESVPNYGDEPFHAKNAERSPAGKDKKVVIGVVYPTGLYAKISCLHRWTEILTISLTFLTLCVEIFGLPDWVELHLMV